jgi:putative oxidoreductase
VRRLHSTFAHGPAGIGLLIIRVVAGAALLTHAVTALRDSPQTGVMLFSAFSASLGVLLLVGLWTPVAGVLAALTSFAGAYWLCTDQWYCLRIGMLSLALALLGPGAWSVDARLFGWRRLEIGDPKKPPPPAE